MPRHQSAARRRVRTAAREGTKYTAAFRRKDAGREPPPRHSSAPPWNAWMGAFDAAAIFQGLAESPTASIANNLAAVHAALNSHAAKIVNNPAMQAALNAPAMRAAQAAQAALDHANIVNNSAVHAALNSHAAKIVNNPAMQAAQDLAMKIAFPYGGGPAARGGDGSSPG